MQSASFTLMILSDAQDTYFCRVLTQKAIISPYKLKVHSSLSTLSWNNFQKTDDQSKLGKASQAIITKPYPWASNVLEMSLMSEVGERARVWM